MCLSTVGHLRGLWSGSYPRILAAKNFFFLQTTGMIGVIVFLVKFICPRNLFAATKNNNHDCMFLLCHVRVSERIHTL